jgi:TPR repeat protein
LRSNTRTALVAAGAQGVQLSESQTRPIDRLIGGEVPAAVLTLVSREAADGFPDVTGFNIFRIPLTSKGPQAEITDQRPADAVVSGSHEKTTRELVAAAMALAERMTDGMAASQGAPPASSGNIDARIAILIARPDIRSVSDLTGKEIAIDDKLPGSSRKIQIAMAAAGATDVRVNERQAKASERVIDGAVPAAVLTLVSREAADAVPEIPGFKIFRIPFTPGKVVDLHPTTQAFAAQLDPRATKPAEAKQTTVAVARDGPRANSGDSSGNVARLMARASALLAQGNIIAARDVLGRAAETGSAQASFTLAETYDPLILPKWGVYGTRGDPTKARELYAKAQAGGIEEAKARFEALASSAK